MKVSVNIPTFNRAHLIRKALDSVLRQTYPDVEIVVLDDGSTDNTRAIVAEYGDRVRYFHQPNGGLGAARNAALDRSSGDVIAFLDSDDEWFDFKLDLQVRVLQRMPAVGFLFTEFVILKDDGSLIHNGSRTWLARSIEWQDIYGRRIDSNTLDLTVRGEPFALYTGGMYRGFLNEAFVLPTTAVVRRSAIGAVRFTERMKIFEDWEFFARLAQAHEGCFLDVETAINRGHEDPGRLTRCSPLAKAESYAEMLERVWLADPGFKRQFPEDVRRASSEALLAVAREGLLASKPAVARRALQAWEQIEAPGGRARARAYSVLAGVPAAPALLKGAILSRKVLHSLTNRHGYSPVNPTA